MGMEAQLNTVGETTEEVRPILSITVLNYNYAQYLNQCLDSIFAQTMTDFEVILINDCSKDDSVKVVESYLSDPRIRFVDHSVNQGYVSSLVEGCNLSRGKYITVISADDYVLDTHAFETACYRMESMKDVVLCYSAWHEVDNSGRIRHTRRGADSDYVHDGAEEVRSMLISSPVLHSGAMIRRSAYEKVGGYDPACRYSVDTNMWIALCSEGKVAYIDLPLYAYRAHNSNLSNTSGAFWTATEEMLIGIDKALARFPDEALPNKKMLRRRAFQAALVAVPTLDLFAGRIRRGWHGYLLSLGHFPALTLLQSRTVVLLARTFLGARGFNAVWNFVRRGPGHVAKPGAETHFA